MIRSTKNATAMALRRSGMKSESTELVINTQTGELHEIDEVAYDALVALETLLSPLHSKEHWDGNMPAQATAPANLIRS